MHKLNWVLIITALTLCLFSAPSYALTDGGYQSYKKEFEEIKKRDDQLYEQRKNQESARQHEKSMMRESYDHQRNTQRERLDNVRGMSREYNGNQYNMNHDNNQHYQQMQGDYMQHQQQMSNGSKAIKSDNPTNDSNRISRLLDEVNLEKVLRNPYAWLIGVPVLGYLLLKPKKY